MYSLIVALAGICFSLLPAAIPLLLAQDSLSNLGKSTPKLSQEIAIPFLRNSHFTPFHAYFSTQDGKMIVYRVQDTGLQFLFENEGFAERGEIFSSDYRFAYALNANLALTIIDPNSLLLVHNVLQLAEKPILVKRINDLLLVVHHSQVLAFSANINQDDEQPAQDRVLFTWQDKKILDATISNENPKDLWVLASDSTIGKYEFSEVDEASIEVVFAEEWKLLGNTISKLLFANNQHLLGVNENTNELIKIEKGLAKTLAKFDSPVTSVLPDLSLAQRFLVTTSADQLFQVSLIDPIPPKLILNAGAPIQLFATFEHFWLRLGNRVSFFDQTLSRISKSKDSLTEAEVKTTDTQLGEENPVFDSLQRFVHPAGEFFMMQLPLKSGWARKDLFFELQKATSNAAELEGQTFVWKPSLSEVGLHRFTAKVFTSQGIQDSLNITIEVRSFNEPPTFLPSRETKVVAGEEVQISTKAIDPDGLNRMLLRYRAKDLPLGALLDPVNGVITWTPKVDQVGKHRFQVIASDQYGASSLQTISVEVIDLTKQN